MRTEHVINVKAKHQTLFQSLNDADIHMNENAVFILEELDDKIFQQEQTFTLVEATSEELGLPNGGTYEEILIAAKKNGLHPCPIEKGILFRLHYLKQPASHNAVLSKQEAPDSAITIATDHDFKEELIEGLYLRNVEGINWLRAFQASTDYHWKPSDRFLFQKAE